VKLCFEPVTDEVIELANWKQVGTTQKSITGDGRYWRPNFDAKEVTVGKPGDYFIIYMDEEGGRVLLQQAKLTAVSLDTLKPGDLD